MSGVLEHIDAPFNLLKKMIKSNLNKNGIIVFLSPSFIDQGLCLDDFTNSFKVPMSLTDIHFFHHQILLNSQKKIIVL